MGKGRDFDDLDDCCDGDMSNMVLGCACCCFIVIPSIILFSVSFGQLNATQWGLDYNHNIQQVGDRVFSSGVHFLGVGHSFIKFPKVLQTIEYDSSSSTEIEAFTSDGLPITLEMSFQFQLIEDQLHALYMEFGLDYYGTFSDVGRHSIAETTANFTAYQFFNDQGPIVSQMTFDMQRQFSDYLHATIAYVQLKTSSLPNEFENAIEDTVVASQNIQTYEQQLSTAQVNASTQILTANYQANITVIGAEASANQYLVTAKANADAAANLIRAEAHSYQSANQMLGMSHDELMEYIWNGALVQLNNAEMYIGFDPERVLDAPDGGDSVEYT